MNPDLINSGVEALWIVVVGASVVQLERDQKVHGLHWSFVVLQFVSSWWFAYYYGVLAQWWSLGAQIVLALVQLLWTIRAVHYHLLERRHEHLSRRPHAGLSQL